MTTITEILSANPDTLNYSNDSFREAHKEYKEEINKYRTDIGVLLGENSLVTFDQEINDKLKDQTPQSLLRNLKNVELEADQAEEKCNEEFNEIVEGTKDEVGTQEMMSSLEKDIKIFESRIKTLTEKKNRINELSPPDQQSDEDKKLITEVEHEIKVLEGHVKNYTGKYNDLKSTYWLIINPPKTQKQPPPPQTRIPVDLTKDGDCQMVEARSCQAECKTLFFKKVLEYIKDLFQEFKTTFNKILTDLRKDLKSEEQTFNNLNQRCDATIERLGSDNITAPGP